jgi:hypothetical protein
MPPAGHHGALDGMREDGEGCPRPGWHTLGGLTPPPPHALCFRAHARRRGLRPPSRTVLGKCGQARWGVGLQRVSDGGGSPPLPLVLALAYTGRGPLGRTPAQLFSILPRVTQCPGGRASDRRHDLFIGLGQPSQTQPAGFKRPLHLPALRVMTFSTGHDRLLVPEGLEGHGACRTGAGRRETPRHNWDVIGRVEYSPRTLTVGSQLCKECSHARLCRSHQQGDLRSGGIDGPRVEV